MVQEWIEGVKLSRHDAIAAQGFQLKAVMTTVMNIFGHQLFVSGRVHGDPHPGNILVRPTPGAAKQYQVRTCSRCTRSHPQVLIC
jgi:aarF domain-containing kinase